FISAQRLPDFSCHARLLCGIDLDYRLDNSACDPIFLGYSEQGLSVFRKARAAITGAGVKEFFSYSAVKTYPPGYVLDVAADFLAQVRHLVYETDFGGQEGVGCIFSKLCRFDRGYDKGSFEQVERPVDGLKHLFGFF